MSRGCTKFSYLNCGEVENKEDADEELDQHKGEVRNKRVIKKHYGKRILFLFLKMKKKAI